MKNVTLEIYVDLSSNVAHCLREMPAYGDTHQPTPGHVQCATLNDGQHRVKVAVYHRKISLDDMKRLARLALTTGA